MQYELQEQAPTSLLSGLEDLNSKESSATFQATDATAPQDSRLANSATSYETYESARMHYRELGIYLVDYLRDSASHLVTGCKHS